MSVENTSSALEAVCRGAAQLIREAQPSLSRVTVRSGDASVEIEWLPVAIREPPPPAPIDTADDLHLVRAPVVGIFYEAPEPGAQPFVSIGDVVVKGRQLGIVEAMKLMNPIEAEIDGQIVEVFVANGDSVEYDQPLFALAPAHDR